MKFKKYTGITWSTVELAGLLEDEESRVYLVKCKKHFGLHPFHLTNLNVSLNEILSSYLNSYDTELKGFILSYQNPKLLTSLGETLYDTCFIHVDVEADFYVFRPEVGSSIKGIVHKKGCDHIGILVHKAFGVSIPKPESEEDWVGYDLEIGQEVRFIVTLLDYNSKLPLIRGTLDPSNYLEGCHLIERPNNKKSLVENNTENHIKKEPDSKKQCKYFATDSENSSDEATPQIKKEIPEKNKKKQIDEEEVIQSELEEEIVSKKHIKKKSKDYSSQSSVDIDIKPEKSSKKRSKKLTDLDSKEGIKKIINNSEIINEKHIKQEVIYEDTVKNAAKRNSTKRKYLNETDNSADDSVADKRVKRSNKGSPKKLKESDISNDEIPIKIKKEPIDIHYDDEIVETEDSPRKKKHKKRKYSENSQDDHMEASNNLQKSSKLNISTCSVNSVGEDTEDSSSKKKKKKHSKKSFLDVSEIKVEPEFESVRIKTEKLDDGYSHNQTMEYTSINNIENISKSNSPKKKHKAQLHNTVTDDEADREIHMNSSKKRDFIDKGIKIKKEKFIKTSTSDEDLVNVSEDDRKTKSSKKHFSFSKVKVKDEKSVDN